MCSECQVISHTESSGWKFSLKKGSDKILFYFLSEKISHACLNCRTEILLGNYKSIFSSCLKKSDELFFNKNKLGA